MKQAVYGALALVVWSVLVFFVGRATIPDRSAEVLAWRDSAAAVARDTAASHQRAREATARLVAMAGRADSAERALAGLEALAVHRGAVVDSLKGALAAAGTASDSVPVLVAIVQQQDSVITELRVGVRDAWEVMGDLRRELAYVQEARQADGVEMARLRATIAAGLEVTKPSRGPGIGGTLRTLALGVGLGALAWEVAR